MEKKGQGYSLKNILSSMEEKNSKYMMTELKFCN